MSAIKVRQLEELFAEKLGNDKKIVHVEETDFLGKGENFGSQILRVDVTVKNEKTGEEEVIHTVAKTLPETEEQRLGFNVQHTVGKEISFYNIIVPRLQEFLVESGVDVDFSFFPILHGGRLNLNGGDIVDDDSIILLENLIISGFKNVSRFEGFDYDTAKRTLKDIAAFHAVPLALKLNKPDVYDQVIKNISKVPIGDRPPPPPPKGEGKGHGPDNVILDIVYENENCLAIKDKIQEKFKFPDGPPPDFNDDSDDPWISLSHNDLWVNNIMVKHEDGKPIAVKLVDFQNYGYASGLKDLFFFMWSSIRQSILEESFDELLKYYHDVFFDILTKFGCDTKPFSYDIFLKEVDKVAVNEMKHALFFMMVVFGKKGGVENAIGFPRFDELVSEMPLSCKEKLWFMVLEWEKRKWI